MAPLLAVRVLEFALILSIFHDYSAASDPSSCFDQPEAKVNSIPDSHLYHKKQKPLIIGHHGNPSKFQENTIDGFKSLAALKADGMELDTFLTKDGKLVVIHFNNTKKLTGKNYNIWDINYNTLMQLNINSTLIYGDNKLFFDKPRKIPLLSEVFEAVKNDDLVMYLNMKPGFLRNRTESEKIGKAVAKLITEKDFVDKVLLASFDPLKIQAAKQENPLLVVGQFYKKGMWEPESADEMKKDLEHLHGMQKCAKVSSDGTAFMKFLFQTNDLLKATNSSFVVMDYNMFNNPKYSNNTFKTFEGLSFGAFIIDNLALSQEQREKDEAKLDLLIQNKVAALVTDDIPRLRRKLGRSRTHKNIPTAVVISTVLIFGWSLRL
ncbi:uncharacterized protein LOC114969028 isoform X2 [Acropora millepora]|uniref:uncharacterized protein LOC114969028 isoform X2 n=1 Tax=Acropora millepora TaxID=45264 RepID=UPI001CF366FB|nr:uncharacterized protein LOC114969028 isoform X2 [Acropora millepora]